MWTTSRPKAAPSTDKIEATTDSGLRADVPSIRPPHLGCWHPPQHRAPSSPNDTDAEQRSRSRGRRAPELPGRSSMPSSGAPTPSSFSQLVKRCRYRRHLQGAKCVVWSAGEPRMQPTATRLAIGTTTVPPTSRLADAPRSICAPSAVPPTTATVYIVAKLAQSRQASTTPTPPLTPEFGYGPERRHLASFAARWHGNHSLGFGLVEQALAPFKRWGSAQSDEGECRLPSKHGGVRRQDRAGGRLCERGGNQGRFICIGGAQGG